MPEPTRRITRTVLAVCLIWAAAFALLEAAYFVRVNEVLPLSLAHLGLVLALVLEFAIITVLAAGGIYLARRLGGAVPPPLFLWAGPWFLLLILAVSHYRDRMMLHARQMQDLVITGVIAVVMVVALFGVARAFARLPWRRSVTVVGGLGAVLAIGGAIWLATARLSETAPETVDFVTAEEAGPVSDTGLRVLIVALDGGAWKVLDPMIEEGRLPAFRDLVSRGATASLESMLPTYSPIIWTTVATGKTAVKHGIFSHVFTKLPLGLPPVPHDPRRIHHLTKVMKFNIRVGARVGLLPIGIYGAHNRTARALWEILGEFGMPSVSLCWFVTHPALPVLGAQVSDRFYLMKGREDLAREAVYPDSLALALESAITTEDELGRNGLLQLVDVADLDAEGIEALRKKYPRVDPIVRGMARDLTTKSLVGEVFPTVPDWRLGTVYYRAMDNAHHLAWQFRGLPGDELDRAPERRLRDTVDASYVFSDELLAVSLGPADENTVVIAMSDHGWENRLWAHKRKPEGFCILAGGPVRPSEERGSISVFDIAPTVLALLGIPVPEDMDGRVATEFFEPAFWQEHPVRTVPSYERPVDHEVGAEDAETNEKILDQLRALGYVG